MACCWECLAPHSAACFQVPALLNASCRWARALRRGGFFFSFPDFLRFHSARLVPSMSARSCRRFALNSGVAAFCRRFALNSGVAAFCRRLARHPLLRSQVGRTAIRFRAAGRAWSLAPADSTTRAFPAIHAVKVFCCCCSCTAGRAWRAAPRTAPAPLCSGI